MVKVGDKTKQTVNGLFVEVMWGGKTRHMPMEVQGTVIHVNEAHRHYTAEFDIGGRKFRESYKF